MAVVRLILRLSSSDHGLRPRCPRCYASSSFVLRLRLRCRGNHCTTPNIKSATLSERAQARGTHAGRRGSRDPPPVPITLPEPSPTSPLRPEEPAGRPSARFPR